MLAEGTFDFQIPSGIDGFFFLRYQDMNRTNTYVRTITEIGIFAALGYVIDELQSVLGKGLFSAGGSIGFAMIAVFIIGLRRGFIPALITGLVMGSLDIATGAYILHPMQALLDYIFPYAFASFGALLVPLYKRGNDKVLSLIAIATVGGLFKFLSHFFAGVFFWNDPTNFAWGLNNLNPYLYSFIYNIAFIGPSIVLCGGLLIITHFKAPIILNIDSSAAENDNKIKVFDIQSLLMSITFFGFGLSMLVTFLVRYFKSIAPYDGGFEADPDTIIVASLSLIWSIICIAVMIRSFRKRCPPKWLLFQHNLICFSSFIYGLARLIRAYMKHEAVGYYWEWVVASFIIVIAFATALFIAIKLEKNN